MLRPMLRRALLAALGAAVLAGTVQAQEPAADYVVLFADDAVVAPQVAAGGRERGWRIDRRRVNQRVDELRRRTGVKPRHVFDNSLGGFAASLTSAQLRALRNDPAIAAIERDVEVGLDDAVVADDEPRAASNLDRGFDVSSRVVPAGVRRVGADASAVARINGTDQRVNVDVAVLDTGVSKSHPDLNVVGGYNCMGSNRSNWDDGYGHGTHVAGTIGALDNGFGVVGVAPGARIWAVKVLNANGSGTLSSVVCGVDWVTAQRDPKNAGRPLIEVANMSLRFGLPNNDDRDCGVPANDALHMAICRSVAGGTTYVVAAGNDSADARRYRPAAYDSAITVGAMVDFDGRPGGLGQRPSGCPQGGSDDAWASYSNFGADLSLVAPSNCTLSTWIGGNKYAWMAGTSASSPHVAGGAALYKAQYPKARPQQVRMALEHAGRLDWRTGTAPTSGRKKILWVSSFSAPPTFSLSAATTAGPVAGGKSLALPVSVGRSNGHSAPVSISVQGLPKGVTANSPTTGGSNATVNLSVAPSAVSGRYKLTLEASDGELVRVRSVELSLDSQPPSVAFSSPAAGLTVQSSTSVTVAWTESDLSGVASRSVQRQRAQPHPAGHCDGVVYSNIGTARTSAASFTESLKAGYCFRWRITLSDHAGNSATYFSGAVLITHNFTPSAPAGPAVTNVAVVPLAGVKVTPAGSVRLEVTWSASGADRHELRLSSNGGTTWSALSLANTTVPRHVLLVQPGSYVVSARARNSSGWGEWTAPAPFSVGLVQDNSSAVTYSGNWQRRSPAGVSGGTTTFSKQAGATARITFRGRALALVSWTAPKRGQADILVNGKVIATIDLRAAKHKRRVVFSREWAKVATRTVEVRVKGTAGRPRVDVDAFIVVSR